MTIKPEHRRAVSLIVLALIAVLWVFVNSGEYVNEGLVYLVMASILILLYGNWKKVGSLFGSKVRNKSDGENKLVGIGKNYKRDFFIGLAAAGGFILLNQFEIIGTIGIPAVQSIADNFGKFLIIVMVAPILEEFLFRDFILDYFDRKLLGDIPFFISAVISAALFALFHFVAYGSNLTAAGGSFLSAGIFGLSAAYIRKYTSSNLGNILFHVILNLWIGFIALSVFV